MWQQVLLDRQARQVSEGLKDHQDPRGQQENKDQQDQLAPLGTSPVSLVTHLESS